MMELMDVQRAISCLIESTDGSVSRRVKVLLKSLSDPPEPLELLSTIQAHVSGEAPTAWVIDVLDELFNDACERMCKDPDRVIETSPERVELRNSRGSI